MELPRRILERCWHGKYGSDRSRRSVSAMQICNTPLAPNYNIPTNENENSHGLLTYHPRTAEGVRSRLGIVWYGTQLNLRGAGDIQKASDHHLRSGEYGATKKPSQHSGNSH